LLQQSAPIQRIQRIENRVQRIQNRGLEFLSRALTRRQKIKAKIDNDCKKTLADQKNALCRIANSH